MPLNTEMSLAIYKLNTIRKAVDFELNSNMHMYYAFGKHMNYGQSVKHLYQLL